MYNFSSIPDVTRKECYDFLVTHGWSPAETEQILENLDNRVIQLDFIMLASRNMQHIYMLKNNKS